MKPDTYIIIATSDIAGILLSFNVCSIADELGSGEFGVVRRGVWSVGGEEREVAVKSLADGSTEEKRIQFLQEAAIMGQFQHPNVIKLYGILLDNPVKKTCLLIFLQLLSMPLIFYVLDDAFG